MEGPLSPHRQLLFKLKYSANHFPIADIPRGPDDEYTFAALFGGFAANYLF